MHGSKSIKTLDQERPLNNENKVRETIVISKEIQRPF